MSSNQQLSVNKLKKVSSLLTDESILLELGQRLAQQRLSMGLTQAQLADQSGIGKRTLERAESGKSIQLITLIRLMRVMDLLLALDQWLPPNQPSPMEQLAERKGSYQVKPRQRVRSKKQVEGKTEQAWSWDDDQ